MHEFELGVWKAVFAHLVRILEAHDPILVDQLNERYSFAFRQSSKGTN